MNGLSNSAEDAVECPLCMEALEVDDLNFYPCTCGYQICRFCWHRIRTDENKLCPACRKEYPENPADFTPLTQEEMIAFKSQKKQRDQQRKQKITENRKHLANVRVVQKNLVFVVGLPPRLADAEVLKKHEYFGKYGKIHKVVINPSTTYAGVQGPSASAYVTYVHNSDALRAIQSVNNIMIDGRLIKTSLGTTKYCSHFMKNQQCPKNDCMYLHELGDPEASFTKEEMHQGKHQEYEKRLHDALIAASGSTPSCGISQAGSITTSVNMVATNSNNNKVCDNNKSSNGNVVASLTSVTMSLSSSSSLSSTSSAPNVANSVTVGSQQKEAWPSLSISPVNSKDGISGVGGNGKNKKEKTKPEKLKIEKNVKAKNKNNGFVLINKENNDQQLNNESSNESEPLIEVENYSTTSSNNSNRSKIITKKEKSSLFRNNIEQNESLILTAEKELPFKDSQSDKQNCNANCNRSSSYDITSNVRSISSSDKLKTEEQRSLCSFSTMSSISRSVNNLDNTSILSDSTSGKSSPSSLNETTRDHESTVAKLFQIEEQSTNATLKNDTRHIEVNSKVDETAITTAANIYTNNSDLISKRYENDSNINSEFSSQSKNEPFLSDGEINSKIEDASAALSKLNIFDDNNSFFSSVTSFHPSLLQKNKLGSEVRHNNLNNVITSQLPDLLNGIDGYQNSAKNINGMDGYQNSATNINDSLQQQYIHQQQIQQQFHHQEGFLQIQDINKHNGLLYEVGLPQTGGPSNELSGAISNFHSNTDNGRSTLVNPVQQQHLLQQTITPTEQLMGSGLIGTNMSKFFDFHKNQQQLNNQHILNAHDHNSRNNQVLDNFRMTSLMENNRINSQFIEQPNNNLSTQHQLPKQISLGKYDLGQQVNEPQQIQQSRLANQFSQNSSVDDDLGFDPFIETQKGLAELLENEVVQQKNLNETANSFTPITDKFMQQQQISNNQLFDNMQRTCMPPPGFHMNAFGFGVPRAQNNKMSQLINIPNTGTPRTISGHATQIQQLPDTWSPNLTAVQQQQQALNVSAIHHQINQNHKGYSNNDWTAMDPAILSLRQFPSFPQQSQLQRHSHQQDIYMQHLTQQQQNTAGLGSQQPHSSFSLPVAMQQQNSQTQVNANVQGMLEFLRTRQFV